MKGVTLDPEEKSTLIELLRYRENNVNALNYNCDFKRLTQLFNRALQIKYYKAKKQETSSGEIQKGSQESKQHFMNEEGDMLEGHDEQAEAEI